jgi:hypothetical protein
VQKWNGSAWVDFKMTLANTVASADPQLSAIAGSSPAADKLWYWTGSTTGALTDFSSFARTLLDDASAAAMRTTLGLVIGTDVQAQDAELAALAGLTSAADKLPYFTGSGTASLADFTAAGRALVDDADATAQRATLGLVINTNVQAYDPDLATWAGVTPGTGVATALGNAANASGGIVTTNGTAALLAKSIAVSAALGTDDTFEGLSIAGLNNSGGVTQWDAVYLNSSSQWVDADANGSGTYPARGLATATVSTGGASTVVTHGTVRNDAWNWTPGGAVYLSTTAGGLTQTAPSGSGEIVQVVGFALTADILFVNITGEYLTLQ